jgi:hypothetical protein
VIKRFINDGIKRLRFSNSGIKLSKLNGLILMKARLLSLIMLGKEFKTIKAVIGSFQFQRVSTFFDRIL